MPPGPCAPSLWRLQCQLDAATSCPRGSRSAHWFSACSDIVLLGTPPAWPPARCRIVVLAILASLQAGGASPCVVLGAVWLLGVAGAPQSQLKQSHYWPSGGLILPSLNFPHGSGCCQYFARESGWSSGNAAAFKLHHHQHFPAVVATLPVSCSTH